MRATANVVYYTSKTLANGEHPLMIRYCKDGKNGISKIFQKLKEIKNFFLNLHRILSLEPPA